MPQDRRLRGALARPVDPGEVGRVLAKPLFVLLESHIDLADFELNGAVLGLFSSGTTAGIVRATRTAMIPITTSSSTSVKPAESLGRPRNFPMVWVPLPACPAVFSRVFRAALLGKPAVAPFFKWLAKEGERFHIATASTAKLSGEKYDCPCSACALPDWPALHNNRIGQIGQGAWNLRYFHVPIHLPNVSKSPPAASIACCESAAK